MQIFNKIKINIVNISIIDWFIILSFGIFSYLYFTYRISGNSKYLFHSSDAASIVSFAAAKDNPEVFKGDELLGNRENFSFYSNIQIPIIRMMAKIKGGYAQGYLALLGPHMFLHLLGFYILGYVLFKSRFWAFLLSIFSFMHVPLAFSFWGMYLSPLPRVSFQVVLPYLFLAALYLRFRPGISWLWLFGTIGFLSFIHFPSTICWGFAIWLSLWGYLPNFWRLSKRIGFMFLAGATLLIGVLLFHSNFLRNSVQGPVADYDLIMKILNYRFRKASFDAIYAFKQFMSNITFQRISLCGIIGAIFVWNYRKSERKNILLISSWIIGIVMISIGIPFIEQVVTRSYKVPPFETSLIRNLRYIFPLMLIFCLWPFAVLARNSIKKKRKVFIYVLGFILVFGWSFRQAYKYVSFYRKKEFFISESAKVKTKETIDILDVAKQLTPESAKILTLSFPQELAVRYYSLRPLVYSGKDGAFFAYSNRNKLVEWYEKSIKINSLITDMKSMTSDKKKLNSILKVSYELGAQFVLIDSSYFSEGFILENQKKFIYKNNSYVLIRVKYDNFKGEVLL